MKFYFLGVYLALLVVMLHERRVSLVDNGADAQTTQEQEQQEPESSNTDTDSSSSSDADTSTANETPPETNESTSDSSDAKSSDTKPDESKSAQKATSKPKTPAAPAKAAPTTTKTMSPQYDKSTAYRVSMPGPLVAQMSRSSYYGEKRAECMLSRNVGRYLSDFRFDRALIKRRWYFSAGLRRCVEFHFNGLSGNANNFETCLDCFNRCYKNFNATRNAYVTKNPHNADGRIFFGLLRANGRHGPPTIDDLIRVVGLGQQQQQQPQQSAPNSSANSELSPFASMFSLLSVPRRSASGEMNAPTATANVTAAANNRTILDRFCLYLN